MNRLLAMLVLVSCVGPRAGTEPGLNEPTLKVATYNVNFGIPGDAPTLEAIAATNADVVLLQETTAAWEVAVREQFGQRYPHALFRHCCGAGGLGVLSRFPFVADRALEPPAGGWFPGMRLVVTSPLGAVQLLSVHLRPPASDSGDFVSGAFSTPPIRVAQMRAFTRALDDALPTLIAGDFNEPQAGVMRLLSARGFRDGLPEFMGSTKTWRWPVGPFTLTGQLDHLAYDARLEPLRVEVLALGNSDHLPVVGQFRRAR